MKNEKDKTDRQDWIRLLANAQAEDLESVHSHLERDISYNYIVKPETGLLMVQARADGSHSRFHLGEVSVTKCVLEVENQYLGYGMVTGSNTRHAELAALFDGLLQHPDFHDNLRGPLLDILSSKQHQADRRIQKDAADTRVEFFTLKRGE